MTDQDSKKFGVKLIIGGVSLLIIIGLGVYLSKNPQLISKWQYQRDSARREEMQKIQLTAPASCHRIRASIFAEACEKLEQIDYDNADWRSGLSQQEAKCAADSHRETTLFKLKFDGESESQLENLQRDEDIILHLCGVREKLSFYFPDFEGTDAQEWLNKWHTWHFNNGNYYD